MDLTRERYKKFLAKTGDKETLKNVLNKKETEPILTKRIIQNEDEPNLDSVNKNIVETVLDISSLNDCIIKLADNYIDLKQQILQRLFSVQEEIKYEEERLKDTIFLCKNHDNFTKTISLNADSFSAEVGHSQDKKTLFCKEIKKDKIGYTVLDVTGNGIAGNNYIFSDNETAVKKDTANVENINDGDLFSMFEYSRMEINNKKDTKQNIIFLDDDPCYCTLLLCADSPCTSMKIFTEDDTLIVSEIQVSQDGEYYKTILNKDTQILNRDYCYNEYNYIYGSGIISFEPSTYIRVKLKSNTNDHSIIYDKEIKKIVPGIIRKSIKISDISLYTSIYKDIIIETEELIKKGKVSATALFSSVYIPYNFRKGESYVTMNLIINGKKVPVVPINSTDKGIKIVRSSLSILSPNIEYIKYIKEDITSIKVQIGLHAFSDIQTPYVGNIKLCIDEEVKNEL